MGESGTEQTASRPCWLRELAGQAALILLLLVALFPGVFLRGEVASGADLLYYMPPWSASVPPERVGQGNPIMSDIIAAMTPYYAMAAQSLAQDEWPLWNPLEMAGLPLLANAQSAVLYPPRLLHTLFDLHTATSIYFLLKLWLCGMTAFACVRGLGLGLFAARLASIAWALNTFNGVWCYWPLPDVSAWLPILFFGVEMAARGRVRAGLFGVAGGGGLMLLAGHPESAFTQALGAGVYLAVRLALAAPRPAALLRTVGICATGWCLALLVTAAQWIPLVEYIAHSYTLNERSGEDHGNFLPPMGLATFFVPRFVGTNVERNLWADHTHNLYSYYPGIAIVIGVGFALALLRKRETRPLVGGLLGACVLCCLWAFAVPGVSAVFRVHGIHALRLNYHIAFAVFALVLLGSMGLAQLPRMIRERRAAWLGAAGVALFGITVVSVAYEFNEAFLRLSKHLAYVQQQVAIAALLAGTTLVLAGLLCVPRLRRAGAWGLIALLSADLVWSLHGINPTLPAAQAYPPTALTDHLRTLPEPARVQAGAGYIPSGVLVPYGIEDWLGYDGLYPERILRFSKGMGQGIWTAAEPVCSIPWYLRNPAFSPKNSDTALIAGEPFPVEDTQRFDRVGEYDGIEIYRNKRALPRAYVAGAVAVLPDPEAIFAALKDPAFVPGTLVYTAEPPEGVALPTQAGAVGHAEVLEHTPTRVRIRAQAERPAVLVLSDAFYPGWRATRDGVDTPIFPAYHVFRAVVIPAGESVVEFSYFPDSVRLGLGLSLVGMLLGSVLALWSLRRGLP